MIFAYCAVAYIVAYHGTLEWSGAPVHQSGNAEQPTSVILPTQKTQRKYMDSNSNMAVDQDPFLCVQ